MPDQPPRLPRLGFAGFEDSSAARGHSRRRSTWLRPLSPSPAEAARADAARLITKAKLYEGLGRRKHE
jgi:hypothetical protein